MVFDLTSNANKYFKDDVVMVDSVTRFWDKYSDKSKLYGIAECDIQRFIKHANQFIRSVDGKRLSAHCAQDIEGYLADKGRESAVSHSVFCDVVLSLRLLFVEMVVLDWPHSFPWQQWFDTRDLEPSHSTIARDSVTDVFLAIGFYS